MCKLLIMRIFLLMVACFAVQSAIAAPMNGDLHLRNPCFLMGAPHAQPQDLIKSAAQFDCSLSPRSADASTVWVRYDLSGEEVDGALGWVYDHTLFQARDEKIWLAYADGRIQQSQTVRERARRPIGGQTLRFSFDPVQGQVVALLARVDGIENRRGPVPRASLTSHARTMENKAAIHLVFGLLTGVLVGILFYNFTLYCALRYRVLAAYCGLIAANLFYGAVWSNLVLWVFPGMTTAFQFDLSVFTISLCFFSTTLYVATFLEDGMANPRLMRVMQFLGAVAVFGSVIRLFGVDIPWRVADRFDYGLYLAAIALLIANCTIAWRRGSQAVRFFVLAWFLPLIVVLVRIFWGLGLLQIESALLDAAVFMALSLEGALTSIGLAWRLRQLQTERDAAEDRAQTLSELALVDSLTGLANRRAFKAAFDQAFGEGQTGFAMALIDLDEFKLVNDQRGHAAGDSLLQIIGARLMRQCKTGDLVARLGGDEFAVLFRNITGEEDVSARSTALLAGLCVPAIIDTARIHVSASLGYALYPAHGENPSDLMQAADAALYAAKKDGKARVKGSGTKSELIPTIPQMAALRS